MNYNGLGKRVPGSRTRHVRPADVNRPPLPRFTAIRHQNGQTMLERLSSAIAANRFGLGARPGELAPLAARVATGFAHSSRSSAAAASDLQLRSSADTLGGLELRRARASAAGC